MGNIIKVFVELADDGLYWGTTQNIAGVVTTYGESLEELRTNLVSAFHDYLETAELEGEDD